MSCIHPSEKEMYPSIAKIRQMHFEQTVGVCPTFRYHSGQGFELVFKILELQLQELLA